MLKNTKGEIYVFICVFVLVIMTVFSVIFTYASIITDVKVQKTNTEIVFDSFVSNNSIIIYNNIKQGKNATDGVDTSKFRTSLKEFCTFVEKDGKYDSAKDRQHSALYPYRTHRIFALVSKG